ncbi:hypothetical protein ccbrp13_30910 [Ktedonobacteria bacterium brp13]|nr:hypothetical protein ccbrp13_30910 [Ktedonobacteria bacterium brp13]
MRTNQGMGDSGGRGAVPNHCFPDPTAVYGTDEERLNALRLQEYTMHKFHAWLTAIDPSSGHTQRTLKKIPD